MQIHCNVLQCTATHCNILQLTAFMEAVVAICLEEARACNTLKHTAIHCNTLQLTCIYGSSTGHMSRRSKSLQHTATQCNTLQHTAIDMHLWKQYWPYVSKKQEPPKELTYGIIVCCNVLQLCCSSVSAVLQLCGSVSPTSACCSVLPCVASVLQLCCSVSPRTSPRA